ncbi:hypothetical protein TWF225_011706 [Orbilia oligospora]|nr:hypothetical protein TWF225_011706 [Orbilia oligospora]KAF3244130.1 hypothetical protein TWF128_009830 [Orbilia oligospora]KAF3244667.1 hypothetical protein TWF217_010712 [Orbilia oligospora]KAF3277855.1 hypothetical protein TWF132_001378 [Orbilia oligospora]
MATIPVVAKVYYFFETGPRDPFSTLGGPNIPWDPPIPGEGPEISWGACLNPYAGTKGFLWSHQLSRSDGLCRPPGASFSKKKAFQHGGLLPHVGDPPNPIGGPLSAEAPTSSISGLR